MAGERHQVTNANLSLQKIAKRIPTADLVLDFGMNRSTNSSGLVVATSARRSEMIQSCERDLEQGKGRRTIQQQHFGSRSPRQEGEDVREISTDKL